MWNLCGRGQLEVASAACGTDDFAAPPPEGRVGWTRAIWPELGEPAGRPSRGRICAGLRGKFLAWPAQGHAREIIDRLNNQINVALADPIMKPRFAGLGGIMLGGSPIDFGKLITKVTEKWANVIRAANINAE